jgi:hypothetical protein
MMRWASGLCTHRMLQVRCRFNQWVHVGFRVTTSGHLQRAGRGDHVYV